jgi:hypothetical protein
MAGIHEYPFSFQLPGQLPPSFEGEYGHIRYTITAHARGMDQINHTAKVAIKVNTIADLNTICLASVSFSYFYYT